MHALTTRTNTVHTYTAQASARTHAALRHTPQELQDAVDLHRAGALLGLALGLRQRAPERRGGSVSAARAPLADV